MFSRWLLILLTLSSVHLAEAQQPGKVPKIGMLVSGTVSTHQSQIDVVRQGLRELGYVEGENILIEYRYAERKLERLPDLAAELVRLKVDVIVTGGGTSIKAVKQVTSSVPIVVGSAGDLVGDGLVASLARPGGNITGSTAISLDASGKRLELLKEIVPKASRVVLLSNLRSDQIERRDLETAARQLGVKLQPVELRDPNEFESAFTAMMKQKANAVIIVQSTLSYVYRRELA